MVEINKVDVGGVDQLGQSDVDDGVYDADDDVFAVQLELRFYGGREQVAALSKEVVDHCLMPYVREVAERFADVHGGLSVGDHSVEETG